MLVVQRIRTEWTKASRGGAGARNATPDVVSLPPLVGAMSGYLLHDLRYREEDRFACRADVLESDVPTHVRLEPLILHITRGAVAARFVWSWHSCGAPERPSHDLFRLTPGQWARLACNGRLGAESSSGREWGYHKTVFNVALTEVYDQNLFFQTAPVADVAQLAVLR